MDGDGAGRERVVWMDDSRQRLVGDDDEVGCVARLRGGVRHDERDAIANAADLVGNQDRADRAIALRSEADVFGHEQWREPPEPIGGGVGTGEHTTDTRGNGCSRDIDVRDAGMRVRRQHQSAMALVGQIDIADVATVPSEEPPVLDTMHRLTDAELHPITPRTNHSVHSSPYR